MKIISGRKKIVQSIFVATGLLLLLFISAKAQRDKKITATDLVNLPGCWTGSLTYLDYTSNKPYTMPAEIIVSYILTNRIPYKINYPKEPKANSTDTITISHGGNKFNGETIIQIQRIEKDSLVFETEQEGKDGNDQAAATIKHIYTISKTTYSIKKLVKFKNKNEWILRHEYYFNKKACN